jgi:hypothetical protein
VNWVPYDSTWLVEVARRQEPDDSALNAALAKCTLGAWESPAYIYFVDPVNANRPGAEWQIDRGVAFEETPFGFVAVDILKDGRVGGVEFVDRVMQPRA